MSFALPNLVKILAAPTEVFANLKRRPNWLQSFIIISCLSVGVAWLLLPASMQIADNMLPENLSLAQTPQGQALAHRLAYLSLLFAPALLLLKWLVIAAVLHFSSVLLDAACLKFKTLYTVVVHAEMILLLMGVINALLLHVRGLESVQCASDLQAIVGLDVLLADRSTDIPLFMFLNSINVFTLWYVATLTIGVSVMTDLSKLKSSVIVGAMWLFAVGFRVAFVAISGNSPLAFGG